MSMENLAGRSCPLRYRYGAMTLAQAPEQVADTLYVIGGLYGNRPALAAVEAMAAREREPATLCFNGDFNWFNIDDAGFAAINLSVLEYDALQGNVEAELLAPGDEADCGCAYPDSVDADIVERSNAIHARLKATARRHPEILKRLATLPMVRRYRVGGAIVGVVHGDADSLAGWRFDVAALDDASHRDWIFSAFAAADVDLFASTHTCLPALRRFDLDVSGQTGIVVNNGAAGMPNFYGRRAGLITRISRHPARCRAIYGEVLNGIHVDAVAVAYEHGRWERQFLDNWPAGSSAHISYYERIIHGPDYVEDSAYPSPLPKSTHILCKKSSRSSTNEHSRYISDCGASPRSLP